MAQFNFGVIYNFRNITRPVLRSSFLFSYKHINNKNNVLVSFTGLRTLFTPSSLNIPNFEKRRKQAENKFTQHKDNFIDKMKNMCQSNERNFYIYTEDLRNMVYLCENTESHIDLLLQMARRYNTAKQQTRLTEYAFGPELLRLFYCFKLPDMAKKILMEDEELKGFFSQVSSYVIAMTLFYDCGHYQDVIRAMHHMMSERVSINLLPKPNLVLVMASCYQLNSEDSVKEMLSFINKGEEYGVKIAAKSLGFAAALAMRRGNYQLALELVSKPIRGYYILKNIKIEALVNFGRPDDALSILRGLTGATYTRTGGEEEDNIILVNTINVIDKNLKENGNKEQLAEFDLIKRLIQKKSLIVDKTIEECLCKPIQTTKDIESTTYSKVSNREKNREMITAAFRKGKKRESTPTKYERTGFNSIK